MFLTTLVAFFMAEMGDKTQIVTAALGARFHDILWVASGTTIGMMLANTPAVFIGERAASRIPVKPLRYVAGRRLAGPGRLDAALPGTGGTQALTPPQRANT